MSTLKRILVPIDFSDESAAALKHAAAMAKQTRAELLVFHVIPAYSLQDHFMASLGGPDSVSFVDRDCPAISMDVLLQETVYELEEFIEQNVDGTPGIRITKKLRVGSLVKEIAMIVEEEKIDLMVVELQRSVPFPNLATLKLISLASKLPCPVLLNAPVAKDDHRSKGRLIPLRPIRLPQVFNVSSSGAFAGVAL
jgi:nucleotide-binding universal stress UspA family protein